MTNPPATLLAGNSFSVTDTVQNIGTVTAAASTTRYYLSPTTSKSGSHQLGGSRAVPSLAPERHLQRHCDRDGECGYASGNLFLAGLRRRHSRGSRIKREQQLRGLRPRKSQ